MTADGVISLSPILILCLILCFGLNPSRYSTVMLFSAVICLSIFGALMWARSMGLEAEKINSSTWRIVEYLVLAINFTIFARIGMNLLPGPYIHSFD